MATSGTNNTFTVNLTDIVKGALKSIGRLGEGESPSPEAYADCKMYLNMLIKQWQGKADYAPGLKTWTRKIGYLFLSSTSGVVRAGPNSVLYPGWTNSFEQNLTTASTADGDPVIMMPTTGVLADDYIGIVQVDGSLFWTTVFSIDSSTQLTLLADLPVGCAEGATVFSYTEGASMPIITEAVTLRNPSLTDQIVTFMTVQEYQALPNKNNPANVANPTSVYVERKLDHVKFFLNVGAANSTTWYLVVEYMEEAEDMNSPQDSPAYPKEWFRALVWGLAKEIAPIWNAPWGDLHEANYQQAMRIARNVEAETTLMFFQPNPPGYNGW